jgi:hypothetical protein
MCVQCAYCSIKKERQQNNMANLPQSDVDAMDKALLALYPIVKKLATIDKSKLDESEDKFIVIRAVRLEHTMRELGVHRADHKRTSLRA